MARSLLQSTPQDSCTSQNRTDTAFAKSIQAAVPSRQSREQAQQVSVETAVLQRLPSWIILCIWHSMQAATCILQIPATIESGKSRPVVASSPLSRAMARPDLMEMAARQLR